jgi:hypothetical protein
MGWHAYQNTHSIDFLGGVYFKLKIFDSPLILAISKFFNGWGFRREVLIVISCRMVAIINYLKFNQKARHQHFVVCSSLWKRVIVMDLTKERLV